MTDQKFLLLAVDGRRQTVRNTLRNSWNKYQLRCRELHKRYKMSILFVPDRRFIWFLFLVSVGTVHLDIDGVKEGALTRLDSVHFRLGERYSPKCFLSPPRTPQEDDPTLPKDLLDRKLQPVISTLNPPFPLSFSCPLRSTDSKSCASLLRHCPHVTEMTLVGRPVIFLDLILGPEHWDLDDRWRVGVSYVGTRTIMAWYTRGYPRPQGLIKRWDFEYRTLPWKFLGERNFFVMETQIFLITVCLFFYFLEWVLNFFFR